ncbi:MAG TPA: hypothetical protein VK771_10445, partial [Acidimicrobiia bacterium]|nr:hypothetical protein [Acidimicrobiia bacterium]
QSNNGSGVPNLCPSKSDMIIVCADDPERCFDPMVGPCRSPPGTLGGNRGVSGGRPGQSFTVDT